MGYLETLYDATFGLGLSTRAADSVQTWANNTSYAPPSGLATGLGWAYSWLDVVFVAVVAWALLSPFMRKRSQDGVRPSVARTALVVGAIVLVWMFVFPPWNEAERSAQWIETLFGFWNANPIGLNGGIVAIVAVFTFALFFNHWNPGLTVAVFVLLLFFDSLMVEIAMSEQTMDPLVVIGSIVINVSFIYAIVKLPIWSVAHIPGKSSDTRTGVWVFLHTAPFVVSYVWVAAMYPQLGVDIYGVWLPASALLLVGAVVLAAINANTLKRRGRE